MSGNPASERLATPQFFRHVGWQTTGNKKFLEDYYAEPIQDASQRIKMFTEDHWWVDRVGFPSGELQRSRLGGVALLRGYNLSGPFISWKFRGPATAESVAILVLEATTKAVKIIVFNLESQPVTAAMTAWDLDPGIWEVSMGTDSNGDDMPDRNKSNRTVKLERTEELALLFEPKLTTIVELKLKSPASRPWQRADLGIGTSDVSVEGNRVSVHSLRGEDAPASDTELRDAAGKIVAKAQISLLKASLDLLPKTTEVMLRVPTGTLLHGCQVSLDPDDKLPEITARNNFARTP